MSGAEPIILHGVDMQRGRDLVTFGDGQQANLSTVSLESWHIGMGEYCRVASESIGQFQEDNTYAVRWTYHLSATGVFECVRRVYSISGFFPILPNHCNVCLKILF